MRKSQIALWIAVGLFLLATGWNVAARVAFQTGTATSLDAIVSVFEKECRLEEGRSKRFLAYAEHAPSLAPLKPLFKAATDFPSPSCSERGDELRATLPPG